MKITFLGTSAAIPTANRGLASIAIHRGGEILIFDAGEGMQRNYLLAKLPINKKTKVFITHMHADHCLGILGLIQTMSLLGRSRKLDIYGEPRLHEFIRQSIHIIKFGLSFDLDIHIIENEGIVLKESEYQISCCKSEHIIPSYSFSLQEFDRPGKFNIQKAIELGIPKGNLFRKLQNGEDVRINNVSVKSAEIVGPRRRGRKIGISGDTRPSEELERFFANSDVLIFEATYTQDKYQNAVNTSHSTAMEAASIAKASKCNKLFLTHFSSRYKDAQIILKEARSIYNNVELAEDLKTVSVPYIE